jgi:hypothetical protein
VPLDAARDNPRTMCDAAHVPLLEFRCGSFAFAQQARGAIMKLKDIDQVNHLIAELSGVKELVALAERADPADVKLFIQGPGDASIEMSADGSESTHYRGFSATPAFLDQLKRLALQEIAARRQAIIGELAALGVEADE